MTINIQKISKDAIIPTCGSPYAAGCDLYAVVEGGQGIIRADETKKIGTGICLEIPEGYFGAIFARSGLAANRGLRPANCVGVIDPDYRGEIIVALHNDLAYDQIIHSGDRIAQLVILPRYDVAFKETNSLSDTERGDGGFGSTGVSI